MNTILIGQDFKTNMVSGLTVSYEENTLYLWSLKVKQNNESIYGKASKGIKNRKLIIHLKDKVFKNRVRLLFKEGQFHNEFIIKVNFNEHPIFELLNLIHNRNIIHYKENEDLIIEFMSNILKARNKNKVKLIKSIGLNILKVIDKLKYNIDDEEIKKILYLLYIESINSQTLVSLENVGNGTLELHNSLEVYTEIKGTSQPDKLHFVPKKHFSALNEYKGGVKTDEHHVGYHFHYCERVNKDEYEYTRYLLAYNVAEKDHLKKLPPLYWEIHKENNVKSNYRLSSNEKFRRAVYHRCNSERRKLFSDLKETDIKQLKFRPKSKDAEKFYDPLVSEKKQNKKRYSVSLV
ncbi:hypothetical protein [Neobacillus drentensis]|uniref:hypothetical protein n=1 Tax=Neobacillus drentensis TaxID=220684 RepID=UPI002FFFF311